MKGGREEVAPGRELQEYVRHPSSYSLKFGLQLKSEWKHEGTAEDEHKGDIIKLESEESSEYLEA